ncbi:MAG: polysaccharide deacetylase family protein [Gammaproteobacteria bacterium]|nr:polysaccharide deacetylase family protein [Gammaproteobacteria bacterium]
MTLKTLIISLSIVAIGNACSIAPYRTDTEFPRKQDEPKIKTAKSDQLVVLISKPGDTLQNLAQKHLGDKNKDWLIADFNNIDKVVPGIEIIIPLHEYNSIGISNKGIQSVPILCYHRFGDNHGKMSVPTALFRKQMKFLHDNNYRVISLKDAIGFFNGKTSIPKRSVVITIDDGYRSNYSEAFPIFKEFNFPATIFLYSDFLGARDALTSKQIKTMYNSGLIDFQPHSKTHPNLAIRKENESINAYLDRLDDEINTPKRRIQNIIDTEIFSFAYPFGDTNDIVINKLKSKNFAIAATVQPGSNTAYSSQYMLRRTMIFGDHTEEEFIAALEVSEKHNLQRDNK